MFSSLQSLFQTQSEEENPKILFSLSGEASFSTSGPLEDATTMRGQIQEQSLQQLASTQGSPSLTETNSNSNTSIALESNFKNGKLLVKEQNSSKSSSFFEDYCDNYKSSLHGPRQPATSCGLSDIFGTPRVDATGASPHGAPPLGVSLQNFRERQYDTPKSTQSSNVQKYESPAHARGVGQRYGTPPLGAPIRNCDHGLGGEIQSSAQTKSKTGDILQRGEIQTNLFFPKPSTPSPRQSSNIQKLKQPSDPPARSLGKTTNIPKVKCNECYKWKDLWRTIGKDLDADRSINTKQVKKIETLESQIESLKSTNVQLSNYGDQQKREIIAGKNVIDSVKHEIANIKNDAQLQQKEMRTRYEERLKAKDDEIETLNKTARERMGELSNLREALKASTKESQQSTKEFNEKLEEMQNTKKILFDKYNNLEHKLEQTEQRDLGIKEELQKTIGEYEGRITQLTSELNNSKREVLKLGELLQAAGEREQELQEDLSEAQNSLKWQKAEEQEKSQAFETEVARLEAELNGQVEESVKYQTMIADLTTSLTRLEAEVLAQRSQLALREAAKVKLLTRHSSQIEKLNADLSVAHSAMEDRCRKIIELQDALDNARSEQGKLKAQSDMAAFSLKLRSRKIEKLEGKLDNRVVEMRSKDGSEQHLNEMQIAELKAQMGSIYSKLQGRDIEIAELRATNKNLQLEIFELKKEAESSRLKVLETNRELESKNLNSNQMSTVIGEQFDKFKPREENAMLIKDEEDFLE